MPYRGILAMGVFISLGLVADPALGGVRYPKVTRDAQGVWIATDHTLVHLVGELWTFYGAVDGLPSDRIRMVAADDREVWVATPRGLGRMDRSSRRWESFKAPEPLPSNNVYAVTTDDHYVWVATEEGLARFDKRNRQWSPVVQEQAPRNTTVFDVLSIGTTTWFASLKGVYTYDRITKIWRHFGTEEGFVLGTIYEMEQIGESLWFICEEGLIRFDLRTRALSRFGIKEGLPSPRVTVFASVQGEIWIGTDKGMVTYNPGSDSIGPFLYTQGMPQGMPTGIVVALPWVWVSTDQGLGMFNLLRRVWEEKRREDGLVDTNIEGLALAGSVLALVLPNGLQGYLVQQDDWVFYGIDDIWAQTSGSRKESSSWRLNFEMTASGEGNFTHNKSGWEKHRQLIPDLRLGMGTELAEGRSLDAAIRLDAGDVILPGVREYDAELRYRGNDRDTVKEFLISDELLVRRRENQHDLLDDAWLEGLGLYQRFGDKSDRRTDPVSVDAEIGWRRGVRYREVFRGSVENTFQLDKRYITPGSDIVKVDGVLLERGVDYIVTHTTGQLTFLNPDKINALSLVEVTYTYEQIPRKETAGRSLLEMLPWDNELGNFIRSGAPEYVTDEGSLYLRIDGAAPKYIDRGWQESVFLDYVQGSTTVSVQIHDQATYENAREIFDYDRPVSYQVLWEETDSVALLDQSLSSGYAVKMLMDRFYVELTIDEKSRSSEILIGLFAQAIRTKGELGATHMDALRPMVGRIRVGIQPNEGLGMGVGYLISSDIEDKKLMDEMDIRPGRYDLATADIWTRNQVGRGAFGGDLSTFLQLARGLGDDGMQTREGQGASGNLIYNSEIFNIRVDGTLHSKNFQTLGNRQTPFGTLAQDLRADTTISPLRFLRFRFLYDRQRSYLDPDYMDSQDTMGINDNLMGKFSFMKTGWPTVWMLASHSLLAAPGLEDRKIRLAGSLEYDLAAGLLKPLGLRKLLVKAYYDQSENDVQIPASTPSEDEPWRNLVFAPGIARNIRIEIKAAPTKTEDGYLRYEQKTFSPESHSFLTGTPLDVWELVMGASSRIIDGVVPTFNGKLSRFQGVDDSGQELDAAQSLLSGQIEMFPGRWIDMLGSTTLALGYGYTLTEQAQDQIMQSEINQHQVEGRLAVGNYDDPIRVETRAKWWEAKEGEPPQMVSERYLESLNRITYRPSYTSPITLRTDLSRLEQLFDTGMGTTRRINPSLEWEQRWSHDFVTKVRLETPLRFLDQVKDENLLIPLNYSEFSVLPWAEIRLRLRDFWYHSLLRTTVRTSFQWFRWLDRDVGAERGWELGTALWLDWEKAGAFIIRLGVQYIRHKCLERVEVECASFHALQPAVKAIGRF